DRQVRLARAGAADEAGVRALLDPLAAGQFEHLGLAQRRHRGEVERVEILDHWEIGSADARLHGVAGPRADLDFGQPQQVLLVALVGGGGFAGQLLELRAHRRQFELLEIGAQQQVSVISHHVLLPGTVVGQSGPDRAAGPGLDTAVSRTTRRRRRPGAAPRLRRARRAARCDAGTLPRPPARAPAAARPTAATRAQNDARPRGGRAAPPDAGAVARTARAAATRAAPAHGPAPPVGGSAPAGNAAGRAPARRGHSYVRAGRLPAPARPPRRSRDSP